MMREEYKFVLWGYGKRGKRFLNRCPSQHVAAIIDGNVELQGSTADGKPIISYEQYQREFFGYDILIAVDDNMAIQNMLREDGIYTYHLLEDTPHEIIGFGKKTWIEELPIEIEPALDYVIYGLNVYTFLLREYIFEKYQKEIPLICDISDKRACAFAAKYEFVIADKPVSEFGKATILWGSRFEEEKQKVTGRLQDIFDFSESIPGYFTAELGVLKNWKKGEKCFIIATGPSLRMKDLDKIYENGIDSFGVNRISLAFEQTKWRPDYLVVMDDKILKTYETEIFGTNIPYKFISDVVEIGLEDKKGSGQIYKVHDHVLEYYPHCPKFSDDIRKRIYSGRTVTYSCIQIAAYMGYKEIYILGADHNYSNQQADAQNHFHKDYYKGGINPDSYFKEKAELAYKSARKYAEEHGIKIYNATRGGKLEVFERIDFDSLFPQT